MPDTELHALARAAARGDRPALDELLRRAQPKALAVCSRMLPCRQDAEEACQDTLVQVATKITTFQANAQFTTWLHAVASNSARMTYRRLRRHAEQVTDTPPATEPADPRRTSVIAGTRLDLLEAVERLERESPDAVPPFVLRDLSGLSYQEIADYLALPIGNVKERIHRARKRIRIYLAQ
ncbi:MAG TPA: RNA polymerase sigma factor [Amycolatopsis sp.]|nr:RNA polymerase sigma factor [Amycolatopsis sp.]